MFSKAKCVYISNNLLKDGLPLKAGRQERAHGYGLKRDQHRDERENPGDYTEGRSQVISVHQD